MPPLNLEDYVISEIHCDANPNCPSNLEEVQPPTIDVKSTVKRNKDDENKYLSVLNIYFGDSEELCAYYGHIVIWGIFVTNEDISNDEKRKYVGINGNSMLYSAARDFLLTITNRGPNPSIVLPTIRFKEEDFVDGKEENDT